VADYLAIYLNDHLAGATMGRELAKRALGNNRGTDFEPFLERLVEEIVEDRQALSDLMDQVGAGQDHLKAVGALVAERLGRFKPNGQLLGYSPLSRMVELEFLTLGVRGKLSMWEALQASDDPRLDGFGFEVYEFRARSQLEGLTEHRLEAARIAFGAAQRTP
jgi:hypothetical protein